MDVYGVDARVASARTAPKLPAGVPVDPLDRVPRLAPVFAAEQPRRLHSSEYHTRFALVACLHVPDVAAHARRRTVPVSRHAGSGGAVLLVLFHFGREGEARAVVVPRLPEVLALCDRRPPRPMVGRRVHSGPRIPRVRRHVEERPPGQNRLRDFPVLALRTRCVDEAGFLRPDEQLHLICHPNLLSGMLPGATHAIRPRSKLPKYCSRIEIHTLAHYFSDPRR